MAKYALPRPITEQIPPGLLRFLAELSVGTGSPQEIAPMPAATIPLSKGGSILAKGFRNVIPGFRDVIEYKGGISKQAGEHQLRLFPSGRREVEAILATTSKRAPYTYKSMAPTSTKQLQEGIISLKKVKDALQLIQNTYKDTKITANAELRRALAYVSEFRPTGVSGQGMDMVYSPTTSKNVIAARRKYIQRASRQNIHDLSADEARNILSPQEFQKWYGEMADLYGEPFIKEAGPLRSPAKRLSGGGGE